MKKQLIIFAALLLSLCGCNKNSENDGSPLTANFTVSPEMIYAGDAVSFEAVVTGGKKPYSYEWTIRGEVQTHKEASMVYTFQTNGSEIVILNVKDAAGATAMKRKAVVINAAKIPETGELALNWVGRMAGYNSQSSAAIAPDGSIYTTCRDNNLYKWSADGQSVWVKEIFKPSASSKSVTYGTPSIDTDGTVFIGGGDSKSDTAGDGTLKAFNPDGTVKWNFSGWWASSGSPAPTCQGVIAAIDGDNIYYGHTGTNGLVMSVNKATGARNGFAAPAGGARSGIAISKAGTLHWYGGQYGLFGIDKSSLDNGGADKQNHKWRIFGDSSSSEYATTNALGQLACVTVDGTPCVAGIATDGRGTKVYVAKAATGEVVSTCYIDDTDAQDQGGIVVDRDGNLVAGLNYTLGQDNGGVIVINPSSGTVVCRFRTQEKISGSPAVDKAGNIHFGTESGFYYVVKPDGDNCQLLVKRNLAKMVVEDARYAESFAKLYTAKIWCSVVIADNGRMYICFTDDDSRAFGGVACLSYAGCEGPAESEWPMIGHDCRHTGKQL